MERALRNSTNERTGAPRSGTRTALVIGAVLALAACASDGPGRAETGADDGPTEASLQRVANSALPSGNVRVRFIDGVAYVTGNVQTAIDANAVARALNRVEGVEQVELRLQREM